jgi:molybdopterin-guanine dinucleotide biosynthesis protein A
MRAAAASVLIVLAGCHHSHRGHATVPKELPRVTREDVVRMLKAGQTEQAILEQLRPAHLEPPFATWTPEALVELKQAGATDAIIQEMRLASERPSVIYVQQEVRVRHY